MKRLQIVSLIFFLLAPLAASAEGLDAFLTSVNVEARADLSKYSIKLSTQFGVPVSKVNTVVQSVREPADAFMVLQLGQFSGKSPETVLRAYGVSKGGGWGKIAKRLGIRPGSAEFHALKSGNFSFTGKPSGNSAAPGKGNDMGKGQYQ